MLDNARCQRNKTVQALAAELGVRLLFLPSYSPNLNLIERLWGFAKRQSVHGKHHADFASFRAAIEAAHAGVSTTHAPKLKSLMTLNFQEFEDVSLLAAQAIAEAGAGARTRNCYRDDLVTFCNGRVETATSPFDAISRKHQGKEPVTLAVTGSSEWSLRDLNPRLHGCDASGPQSQATTEQDVTPSESAVYTPVYTGLLATPVNDVEALAAALLGLNDEQRGKLVALLLRPPAAK